MNNYSVINQLKTILKNSSDLSFVKDIFIGARSNLINTPAIYIIPSGEEETTNTNPEIRIALNATIYGANKIFEDDDNFVSSNSENIGILDFLNRVKKVLDNNNTLDNTVINIVKGNTNFGYEKNSVFFGLSITLEYRTYYKERN